MNAYLKVHLDLPDLQLRSAIQCLNLLGPVLELRQEKIEEDMIGGCLFIWEPGKGDRLVTTLVVYHHDEELIELLADT